MWTDLLLSLCLPFAGLVPVSTQEVSPAPLPPAPPWGGESRALIAPADDPWITPAERSGLTATPSYEETFAWLERLVSAVPQLELVDIGTSDEGRPIRMVIASSNGAKDPAGLARNGKPTLLAQGGIHSGEIDGKDAGLMLLRDMTVGGKHEGLLDEVNFLFIPILNVDGHERISPFNRINQRGPERMGWRTNARNLNLNRDYAKLDTPGVRAVVGVIGAYDPELYFDLHVTDGIDYQYDITYGFTGPHGFSPASATWLRDILVPGVDASLTEAGHVPGPLVFSMDGSDPAKGLIEWTGSPRFSNSYGDLRHTPTVLVENHSLKPYDQRVLGTYVLLESSLWILAIEAARLREAIAADRAARPETLTVAWGPGTRKTVPFKGVAYSVETSEISGGQRIIWSGVPEDTELPILYLDTPTEQVQRPKAYWVPPTYADVIERLQLHGVRMERINGARELELEVLRFTEHELGTAPFEGRVTVTAKAEPQQRTRRYPPGSVRVPTDQDLGDLVVLLLEPSCQDSFFQWGFFLACLQRTEYVEGYVIEPLAERMLAADEALRAEWEAALEADADLAGNPRARLEWFYRRSPWHDSEYGIYPVGIER